MKTLTEVCESSNKKEGETLEEILNINPAGVSIMYTPPDFTQKCREWEEKKIREEEYNKKISSDVGFQGFYNLNNPLMNLPVTPGLPAQSYGAVIPRPDQDNAAFRPITFKESIEEVKRTGCLNGVPIGGAGSGFDLAIGGKPKKAYGIKKENDCVEGLTEVFRIPEWDPVNDYHMNYELKLPDLKKPLANIHIPMKTENKKKDK